MYIVMRLTVYSILLADTTVYLEGGGGGVEFDKSLTAYGSAH